jgi:hypothetical protein
MSAKHIVQQCTWGHRKSPVCCKRLKWDYECLVKPSLYWIHDGAYYRFTITKGDLWRCLVSLRLDLTWLVPSRRINDGLAISARFTGWLNCPHFICWRLTRWASRIFVNKMLEWAFGCHKCTWPFLGYSALFINQRALIDYLLMTCINGLNVRADFEWIREGLIFQCANSPQPCPLLPSSFPSPFLPAPPVPKLVRYSPFPQAYWISNLYNSQRA